MDELIGMMERVSILGSGVDFRLNYQFAVNKLRYDHAKAEAFALEAVAEQRQLDAENMRRVMMSRNDDQRKRMLAAYLERKKSKAEFGSAAKDAQGEVDEMESIIRRLQVVSL